MSSSLYKTLFTEKERAMLIFLEQYSRFLHALKRKKHSDPSLSLRIPHLFYIIHMIQHIHLQKYKLLRGLNHRLESDAQLERPLSLTLQRIKLHLIRLDARVFLSSRYLLEEIGRYYAKKNNMSAIRPTPSAPWIHPSVFRSARAGRPVPPDKHSPF